MEETKKCKHCQSDIPKKAKVCPVCKKKQLSKLKVFLICLNESLDIIPDLTAGAFLIHSLRS